MCAWFALTFMACVASAEGPMDPGLRPTTAEEGREVEYVPRFLSAKSDGVSETKPIGPVQ
jgi:hypothetical protein